jgi:AAA15 family ATPase/GTPase
MRIKSIEAKNFKSLVDFRIELTQFNCLIGLNGSGKSTVLQFIDFVSQLVRGDMKGWLDERKWSSSELKSKLSKKTNIELYVFFEEGGKDIGHWYASYNPSKNRCTQERFELPQTSLEVKDGKIQIKDSDEKYNTSAHIAFDYEGSIVSVYNDGMLRLIAILAELKSGHQFLLFDEIENGINPELIEFVIDSLTSTDKQVIVTTHSPMILNYLSDEIAKSGVIYLYKTPEGLTKAIQFFSIPSIAEKLTVMGPGEVFVDTNLTGLIDEIQSIDTEAQ